MQLDQEEMCYLIDNSIEVVEAKNKVNHTEQALIASLSQDQKKLFLLYEEATAYELGVVQKITAEVVHNMLTK